MTANYWIEKLKLQPHPEGGYYKRFYESTEIHNCSDGRGFRPCLTSIWFLIPKGVKTKFHKIKSDELWFFHSGNPLNIVFFNDKNSSKQLILSNKAIDNHHHTCVMSAGIWFASEALKGDFDYSLVSCAVSPGFDFEDFALFNENGKI